ncbi:MAG: histone H1 [Phycisphaerales bacterium]|nr:histone H1 [Phycisphaerales bacterium]
MDIYAKLQKLVNDAREDIEKAAGGNQAAGTRARKAMQEIKAASQELREAVLTAREEPKP